MRNDFCLTHQNSFAVAVEEEVDSTARELNVVRHYRERSRRTRNLLYALCRIRASRFDRFKLGVERITRYEQGLKTYGYAQSPGAQASKRWSTCVKPQAVFGARTGHALNPH